MDIDNKHRQASWEKIAKEFQSERDQLRIELYQALKQRDLEATSANDWKHLYMEAIKDRSLH